MFAGDLPERWLYTRPYPVFGRKTGIVAWRIPLASAERKVEKDGRTFLQ